jgi:hypothetical protein
MMIRWTVSGLAIALLLGTAASAAPLSSLPSDAAAGVSSAPTSPPGDFDLGLVRSMLDGHGKLWAQQEQACQKVTQPCDDQHPCCKGLTCNATLLDKTKICDFRG